MAVQMPLLNLLGYIDSKGYFEAQNHMVPGEMGP